MWKRLGETQYFLLFTKKNGYEICVTDYLCVWIASYTEKSFLAELKESNDGLELPDENEFIEKGIHLLSNLDKLKKFHIEKQDKGLFISMMITFGFPFYLKCKLTKGLEELYFEKVTKPLLNIICDLRGSQSELRRLLLKKDSEIEEYKCEGGEIVLRHLKTVAFNEEQHMRKFNLFEENFGANSSTNTLVEAVEVLERDILKRQKESLTKIKTEPSQVKTEPIGTVKIEPIPTVKMEPNSQVVEDSNEPVVTASGSCKQEIKRETIRAHVPRKRSKFNF